MAPRPEDLFISAKPRTGPDGSRQIPFVGVPFELEGPKQSRIHVPNGAVIDLDHKYIAFDAGGGRGEQRFALTQVLPAQGFIPAEIANWLGGIPFPEFRGEDVVQDIPVEKETFYHREFDDSYAFVPVNTRADNESEPNQVSAVAGVTQQTVQYHRLATFIPRVAQAQTVYDLAGANGRLVMRLMRLNKELEEMGASGQLATTSGWAANHAVTLGAGFQWGGASGPGGNANPIEDLFNLVHLTPAGGNEIDWNFNRRTAQFFLEHPIVQNWMKFDTRGNVLGDVVSTLKQNHGGGKIDFNLPGLGRFHIHTAQWKATPTTALDYIMPDGALAVVQYPGIPTNGMEIATAYNWELKWPTTGAVWNTREIPLEARGAGGTLIIVETARLVLKVGTGMGGWITGTSQ